MTTDRAKTRTRSKVAALLVSAACFGAVGLTSGDAAAQPAGAEEDTGAVTGTAKGIVGGALLGGEIVMIPMGAAGLKPWWPYLVFGGLGSVGGAVGGWAVEQADPPAEAPLYMLAGGLALIIPTVVLSASAITRNEYEDTEDPSTLEQPPAGGTEPGQDPATAPGQPPPEGSSVTVTTSDARGATKKVRRKKRARPQPTVGMIDVSGGEVRMGVPALQIKNMYTLEEIAKYGVEQKTEVDIPVVSASF